MSARVFLDTNVVAYAFDPNAPAKQRRSRKILAAPDWAISWQVVQEFANLARHRFPVPMTPADLTDFIEVVLWPHCEVLPSMDLYRAAMVIHQQTQYRIYDSLVVAAAIASGADVLYTEDLQHGRVIGSLMITNPFLER